MPKTDFVFLALFGTVALGAIGVVNIVTTDYVSDPLNPQSNLAPLSGIICLIPPACVVTMLERMVSIYIPHIVL